MVVHVINNRYDWMQDTVKPVQDKTLNIRLLAEMIGKTLTITHYTPETTAENLSYLMDGERVTVTLPDLNVWGIIHITSQ